MSGRRDVLLGLGGVLLSSCKPAPPPPPVTRTPIASIPDGGRLPVRHDGVWVELRRRGSSVEARRLNCTHFGCEVPWNEEKQRYLCRCHDGVFDPDGRPVSGPPTRPLASVPVRIEGGDAVLEG